MSIISGHLKTDLPGLLNICFVFCALRLQDERFDEATQVRT